jgi:FkbM family methyltransferase
MTPQCRSLLPNEKVAPHFNGRTGPIVSEQGKLSSPKNIVAIAKYMYIKNLLDHYEIDLIIDVDANRGQFARSIRQIGYSAEIISFEPLSAEFERLKAAAHGDPKWKTCNFALGEAPATKTINVMADSRFSSFNAPLTAETRRFVDANTVVGTEHVEIRTLREVVREFGVRDILGRTFLKSDTQGFDMHVLKGAGELLRAIPIVQMEVSIAKLYENTPGMTEMLQFMEQSGFVPVAIVPITTMADLGAIEMDYLGVNRKIGH